MKKDNIKYCFYTGGWDSTYMILYYLINGYKVKPIYIIDKNRKSYVKEEETINVIIEKINEISPYKNNLLEIEKIELSSINVSSDIEESYKKIKSKVYIGTQYPWLSEIAKKYGNVSIGIEKPSGEYSGCVEAIKTFGALKKIDNISVIDKKKSKVELVDLMGNFSFPIIDITEKEMIDNIKKWEFEDIMKQIWFCHNPINNMPCGLCRPCEQKMECDMNFLLPKKAQKRYYFSKKLKKICGFKIADLYKKIIRKINN